MTGKDRPSRGRVDRAQEIGLFRYALIREAADPALSPQARGVLVRAIAETEHTPSRHLRLSPNPRSRFRKPRARWSLRYS